MQIRRLVAPAAGALFLVVAAAGSVAAQIFTPTYLSPRTSSDVGVYFNDGPGDFSVEGILRRGFGGYDLGFRGGLADTGDLLVLLGLDYRNPIMAGEPLGVAVTGGAQAGLGDASVFGLTAGLTVGPTVAADGVTFTPYAHPRVALVDGTGGDGMDLELLADIGVDLAFNRLELRFGATFEDQGADWGIGISWR